MKHPDNSPNYALLMIILAVLALSACGDSSQKGVSDDTKNQKDNEGTLEGRASTGVNFEDKHTLEMYHAYMELKNGLVADDVAAARKAAILLAELSEEAHPDLEEKALKIKATADIEVQRKLFSELSTPMETIFKKSLTNGAIYKQFCPMAFNNSGAYWFSDSDQVRNPYFGDMMLKCGVVKETIQ